MKPSLVVVYSICTNRFLEKQWTRLTKFIEITCLYREDFYLSKTVGVGFQCLPQSVVNKIQCKPIYTYMYMYLTKVFHLTGYFKGF